MPTPSNASSCHELLRDRSPSLGHGAVPARRHWQLDDPAMALSFPFLILGRAIELVGLWPKHAFVQCPGRASDLRTPRRSTGALERHGRVDRRLLQSAPASHRARPPRTRRRRSPPLKTGPGRIPLKSGLPKWGQPHLERTTGFEPATVTWRGEKCRLLANDCEPLWLVISGFRTWANGVESQRPRDGRAMDLDKMASPKLSDGTLEEPSSRLRLKTSDLSRVNPNRVREPDDRGRRTTT